MKAYTQNVPDAPRLLFKKGKVSTSNDEATHSERVAIVIATPRTRFGKISARATHT